MASLWQAATEEDNLGSDDAGDTLGWSEVCIV